ncbi:MAG: type II toxin-antitoxin system PemK/MazF family toxin [Planctomycetota bacterium]|nr:MAG: type II toxin-antitoxin system PemK/MazF family toxin [Planctomycetota bacterium]REJ97842.1 MAG: type II toxin-antitoxin system PemK/MazF family toxin [Planctomycetota bacterium]REK34722.1 MAG: type II toxin-antitoxin system PemK/MazF family toxin [Planctomycetota bacterium]
MLSDFYRGDVVWVRFDPTVGCEIRKCRPAVVVSADQQNGRKGNELVIVVPLTKAPVDRSPRDDEAVVEPGTSGLTELSVTVVDQVRSIDRQRILRWVGHVSAQTMALIDERLQGALALA